MKSISRPQAAPGLFVESLERRAMLAAAATYFKHLGPLQGRALPAASVLETDAGHRFGFSAAAMKALLPTSAKDGARVVSLPTPDGGTVRLRVTRSNLLAPKVAAANPGIRTYSAVGVDDKSITATFDLSINGLHATVLSGDKSYLVSPLVEYARDVARGGGEYVAYDLDDVNPAGPLICEVDDMHDHDEADGPGVAHAPTGPTRVTVRLAAAANGEWTALAGGTQSTALARIVTNINYAEAIYNTEFNIGFTLVSGTNLIYTDAATDPYTNTNASTMLGENQVNLDSVIGSANYDIGHVFTTSGGGIASLGVVGRPGSKGRGVTGNNPNSGTQSQFTFAHEMGHQFNSHHTWNTADATYASQRSAANAYEPGPGSTILSYGGFGFPGDFIPISGRDNYFHARSIEVITNYLVSDTYGSVVGTRTATGNTTPTVNAGVNKTIPALTPFELTGSATDNNTALTYGWEQYDLGDADAPGIDDGDGPLFRSRRAVASPTRSFPELADVLAGRTDNDEYLPQVSRSANPLTFRLTVRDGLGGVNSDDVDLTVQATGQAFAITSQNAAGTVWPRGSTQTVTWDVAGTTASAFDAANVAVLISYDNGATFTPLLASTPNTGSASITVPSGATISSVARIKIKPLNNVFYDINNATIAITSTTVSTAPGTPDLVAASDTGSSNTDNLTNRDNSAAARNLQFDVTGTISGATVSLYNGATFLGSAVASGTTTTVTTNGTVDLADGVRNITARQTESGKTQSGDSPALPITVDTVAPALASGGASFQYVNVKPRAVFTFDSPLAFGSQFPTTTRTSPTAAVISVDENVSGAVVTLTYPSAPNGILENGRYTATVPADTYRDAAGNSNAVASLNFFVLAGDANRDATVNFNDFLALQTNFGTSALDFTKGDFNYDGVIDFNDFLLMQTNFGVTV